MKELRDSWIDILVILSDNKGHPLWELAEKVQREKSNLYLTLELLEAGRPEGPWDYGFMWYEFRDLAEFTIKLHEAKDPLSRLILERTNSLFGVLKDADQNPHIILSSINDLLDDANLIDNFSNAKVNSTLKQSANEDLGWAELRRFNRLLLEEAYANDIYRAQNSIIYSGASRKTTNPKSRHPNVKEIPYYISENLYVFNFILTNIGNLLDILICPKNIDSKKEMAIPDGAQGFFKQELLDPDKIDLEDDMPVQIKKEIEKNSKRFCDFIQSNYTYSMIKKFGLKVIDEIVEGRNFPGFRLLLAKKLMADNLLKNQDDIKIAKKIIVELSYLEDDNESVESE